MKVHDPSGQTWRVSRRWVPWRRRLRGADTGGGLDLASLGDDPISLLVAIVVGVLLLPLLLVGLLAILELLAVLAILPFALVGRMVFGRHWHVELRHGFRPHWEVEAGSWSQSATTIHEVADQVRRGDIPVQTLGLD